MEEKKTICLRVYGIVQGVGFRPTVSRHAITTGVRGSVSNMGPYVEIIAQGEADQVEKFADLVIHEPPVRAVILKSDREELREDDERFRVYDSFDIIESEKKTGEIFVSPDIATCDQCRQELFDPSNRRYLHPFINCTCCGPRLTILDGMPYDRVRTSMAEFPMCPACRDEYTDPDSRRYDAQPVCCNDCGPEVYLLGSDKRREEAIRQARRMIADGKIIAIKGIGGFHLCCDASNEEAVARLRERKKRPVKPFAVMMRDIDAVRRECQLDDIQEEMLTGHQKPIVLLKRKKGNGRSGLCQSISPGNPKIGVMLPYAPIQMLIFDYPGDQTSVSDCLVMTSGNISGAPICRDDQDAVSQLGHLCDAVLSHNRLIRIRADDSVMDYFRGRPYMIRRSRGFAPLPFIVGGGHFQGSVLAVGGELKNTFCISKNDLFYPSPYIGDMEDVRTVKAHMESVRRMEELLEASPQLIVSDMHPAYHTVEAARELAQKRELLHLQVQHHYAHILSCMAENEYTDPVIGISFDGTGYGQDGTIWGGEIMTADLDSYVRRGSIQPFMQAGGDLSAKEGWRIAVSLIRDCLADVQEVGLGQIMDRVSALKLCDEKSAAVLLRLITLGVNSVKSTSAGRLFDGVSALLGICRKSTFEGDASMRLEFAAEAFEEEQKDEAAGIWHDIMSQGPDLAADTGLDAAILKPAAEEGLYRCRSTDLFAWLMRMHLEGTDPGRLSYIFHAALAAQAAEVCCQVREESGINTAALSGGVFQNQLFLRFCAEYLEMKGFRVLTHSLLPPNDAGICLGQAVYGARYLQKTR